MTHHRRALQSTDEPNAFRISRPPTLDPFALVDPHPDPALTSFSSNPISPDAPASFSHFPRVSDTATAQPPSDPASWLPSTDLSSPTFNAHHFLQRVLSHRYDKSSRPTRLPQLDDAFDADAALAALDTVESALRRRRDAARREELAARDDLRSALHHSAKRRDDLVRTAHAVTSHVTTFGDVGRQAAVALQTDLAALKSASARLAALQDARDLLSLLTRDASELDAVRVSKLLASAKALLDAGQLNQVLPKKDVAVARNDILRCESELASSIFEWMKRAADDANPHVITECAMAAEQLGVSHKFVEAYVKHVFGIEDNHHTVVRGVEGGSPPVVLETFRTACWEAVNVVRESLTTVFESFSDPSRPLASLLHMILEKRVLAVADAILSALIGSIRETEALLKGIKNSAGETSLSLETGDSRRRSSIERMRNLAIADSKESWRENAQRAAVERRRYLIVSADLFTSLAKLRTELFELCRVPGAEDVEKVFSTLQDPYREFMNRHLGQYLEVQKKWIDDQLGVAFFEITRIDLHAPRLAPRERSNADVYHRYRSFYGHVSSSFHHMTKKAIQSTHESICRSVAVLRSIRDEAVASEDGIALMNDGSLARESSQQDGERHEKNESDKTSPNEDCANGTDDTETGEGSEGIASSARSPSSMGDRRLIVRELLDSLVMNYLANAETLLQAATHLLPLCEKDAKMQQLWVSGASPLTSYVKAIELLSKSNEVLDRFILTLEVPLDPMASGENLLTGSDLDEFIPKETREVLHGELTSGLSDLGAEAQIGVKAAVSSLRARLFSILGSPHATEVYKTSPDVSKASRRQDDVAAISNSGLDFEPSDAFISASTLIDQQLQSVMESVRGKNRDFVVSELRSTTREAVLHCWCSINGIVTSSGALQLIADGKSILRVFHDHRASGEAVECLPSVGQLFLEGADGLWSCVESNSLANVDADVIVALLRKRDDFKSERVSKVCQSLGAELDSLNMDEFGARGVDRQFA